MESSSKTKEKATTTENKRSPIFVLFACSKVQHCTFWYLILGKILLLGKKSLFQQGEASLGSWQPKTELMEKTALRKVAS